VIKEAESTATAKFIGWREITDLPTLQAWCVENYIYGDSVWVPPENYVGFTHVNRDGQKWLRTLDFNPWENANDDLSVLEYMKTCGIRIWSDYKDELFHEMSGHGTHNVWEYYKGKFANALVNWRLKDNP